MIEVEMMKDIRKYEGKFIGPFTKRQICCVGISLIYEVPFVAFFKFIPMETRLIIASILFIPMYICGWQKKYGMGYEIYMTRLIYRICMVPSKRIYKNNNIYRQFRNQLIKEKQVAEMKELSKMKKSDKKDSSKRNKSEPVPAEFVPYK